MLELQHISKSFSGVPALTGVSMTFKAGEVHALCGENGAGKSTLMNIISGNLQPGQGKILLNGQQLIIRHAGHAQSLGIGIVYQERSLVNALTVAENIFVTPPVNRYGLIDHTKLYKQTQALLNELKLINISPKTKVDRLSAAQKQMVEIAKALAQKACLLILDEPTASLTHAETETLFTIIRKLKQQGNAVIYISHRMKEIKEIADTVSILKDGCYQGSFDAANISTEAIIAKMVGRDLWKRQYLSHRKNEKSLDVQGLSGKGFRDISLTLHRGEIVGIAGLLGSGREALARAIFGDTPHSSGTIHKNGTTIRARHPRDAIRQGIAYIPDERKTLGLFMDRSISDNIVSAKLDHGMFNSKSNDAVSEAMKIKLGIRTPSVRQAVQKLSGGNQQKVVLAKWLDTNPDVLVIHEPTHGVDVGAKEEIYSELKKLTAAGKSILLISSELQELLLLGDRIAVMYNGEIRDIIENANASEELITQLASGL